MTNEIYKMEVISILINLNFANFLIRSNFYFYFGNILRKDEIICYVIFNNYINLWAIKFNIYFF